MIVDLPDALQMHWPNLDDVPDLLAFQYTITAPSGHASNIEQFRAINHMVVCAIKFSFMSTTVSLSMLTLSTRNANTLSFDLKAKTSFILP